MHACHTMHAMHTICVMCGSCMQGCTCACVLPLACDVQHLRPDVHAVPAPTCGSMYSNGPAGVRSHKNFLLEGNRQLRVSVCAHSAPSWPTLLPRCTGDWPLEVWPAACPGGGPDGGWVVAAAACTTVGGRVALKNADAVGMGVRAALSAGQPCDLASGQR